jgi:hypothetical protein
VETLCYPAWEIEYRLKFLQELKDYSKVFLFTTFPAHKGIHQTGSVLLAEIIKTYNPRLVLVSGAEQKQETVGKSLVVSPGSLADGNFALIDLRTNEVTPGTLRQSARAA